jgi:hypothetical protein
VLQAPVILDADMTAAAALERLRSYPSRAPVVVRWQRDLEVFFHAFRVGELTTELERGDGTADPDRSLVRALALERHPPAPVRQLATADPADPTWGGVLLDGLSVVGVAEPEALAPPPVAATSRPESPPRGGGFLARMRRGRSGPSRSYRSPDVEVPDVVGAPPPPRAAAPPPASPPDLGRGDAAASSDAMIVGAPPAVSPSPASASARSLRRVEAHPRLELEKEVVEPGERFDLVIGLAREAVEGVSGTMVTASIPAAARHLDLDVQLVADEFEAPAGWYFRLRVPVDDPESARIAVPLVAPGGDNTRQALLEVHFSHQGVPAGVAFRRIAVRPTDAPSRTGGGVPWLQPVEPPSLLMDPDDPAPDLWITISKPDGNEATGRFVWSFQSPHPVELPREPLAMDLGDDARTFAGRMIRLVAENEGTELIDETLVGLGRQVAEKAPAELETVLRSVHEACAAEGRVPAVLLQSAEAHVPWELAVLEDPPDPDLPPFLGAQAAVGRWLLGPRTVRIPPAREVAVRSMAVVAGDYKSSRRLRPLPQAEEEGDALVARYGAARMAATASELDRLLAGDAEAIHFACHGEVDPGDPATGKIFLNDDQPLDPVHFLQAKVGPSHQPFLFLNACQVGQAGELLGDYAGFAGSCLRNGFRGFVAPLWSVDDEIAHAIALDFYQRAFGDDDGTGPTPVGEVLRRIRARFPSDDRVPPSTWLAYVFYGNPHLLLRRA